MGRNLLEVPLGVLVAQAEATRIHLRAMPVVREAFLGAGQDLEGLEGALAEAIAAGSAAVVAAGLAVYARREASGEQQSVCGSFAEWTRKLRRRLAQASASEDHERVSAARRVRARIGDPRRFAGTLSALRQVVPELGVAAEALRLATWRPDLLAEGEALLARAEEVDRQRVAVADRRRLCSRAVASARRGLQRALIDLRRAWKQALDGRRVLGRMPVGELEGYFER